MFSYPLTAQTDMPHKMKLDCQEICSNVMEKHSDNEAVRVANDSKNDENVSVAVCQDY